MISRLLKLGAAAAAPWLLLSAHGAAAASLDVSPVRIDLPGPGRPGELRLTNVGKEELSVQVDTRQWSQDSDGSDELVGTDVLLAVPPLFTIGPGERQIVRVGYLGAADGADERSFRLIVSELAPAARQTSAPQLAMRLRLSIPVFVAPPSGIAAPDIVVSRFTATPDGGSLTLRNVGTAHTQLKGIDLRRNGEWLPMPKETVNLVRYLLPNAQALLRIPGDAKTLTAVRISSIDGREWEHAVSLTP
jgi:fimbrial chaperone protein